MKAANRKLNGTGGAGFRVALGWLLGAYRLAIKWLWDGSGVACMWLWGSLGVALYSRVYA
jgi:hypothetical protein